MLCLAQARLAASEAKEEELTASLAAQQAGASSSGQLQADLDASKASLSQLQVCFVQAFAASLAAQQLLLCTRHSCRQA